MLKNFDILFNGSYFIIVLGSLLLILYTIYIYKYTIPKVNASLKYFLILTRSVSIVILLVMIFEPQLIIKSSDSIKPVNILFIDNSSSLAVKDSSERITKVNDFQHEFIENVNPPIKKFLFGLKPVEINVADNSKLNFSEPLTNFSKLFDLSKISKNIGSITIISDGIITDGYEPIYDAEKLSVPIFTIGVGDTSLSKDLLIKDVLYNQNIYAEKPTEIEAQLINYGYENSLTRVSLYEDNKLVQTKDITLSQTGINKVIFDYTPLSSGDKKMKIATQILKGEANAINNSKTFYLDVLRNKVMLTVVAGSPSSDLSTIISSVSSEKNIDVKKIVEISKNKFSEENNFSWIDSAEVLFLIDFPRETTSKELIDKTFNAIKNYKPFFILVTPTTSILLLKQIENLLPFSFNIISSENISVQPELVQENFNSIFSTITTQKNLWNSLPPLTKNNTSIILKPESVALIKSIHKNIPTDSPLLVARSIGRQRSMALLAGDVWKWQLSLAENNPILFKSFYNDIIRWLNISDPKKQIIVRTSKKIYDIGENVEFVAELYDQTFNPISDADISLKIFNSSTSFEIKLNKIKDGLFTGNWENSFEGDFSFEATAQFDGTTIKSDVGRFSITTGSIEKYDTRMNIDLLKRLAQLSGGKYYSINEYKDLFTELNKIHINRTKISQSIKQYELWNNSGMIIILICLFAFEWFIRKRVGML